MLLPGLLGRVGLHGLLLRPRLPPRRARRHCCSRRLRAPPPRSRRFHRRRPRPGFLRRLRAPPPDRPVPRPHPRRPPSGHLPHGRSHPLSRRVHLPPPERRRSRLRPPRRPLPSPRRTARRRSPTLPRGPLPPGRAKTSYTRDRTRTAQEGRTARISGQRPRYCSRVPPEMSPERQSRPLPSEEAREHGDRFPKTNKLIIARDLRDLAPPKVIHQLGGGPTNRRPRLVR